MAEDKDAELDDPPCSRELCEKLREGIAKRCRAKGWPPGTPFYIYQPDGKLCFCLCP
jgi:hypothetical protein